MAGNLGNELFDNLKDLGLDNLSDISIYNDKEDEKSGRIKVVKQFNPSDFIFDRKVDCPVCIKQTTVKAVKSSGIRVISRESDFMTVYQDPNPLFYDVWLCSCCGYAALSSKFNTISDKQIKLVKENISAKWKFNKTYPAVYDIATAIETHQLALLNAVVMMSRDSEKAMICLRLGWLYRIKKDEQNERKFLLQALQGFSRALEKERFPVFGLDENSLEYLIGELYRRLGDNSNALLWFSRVLCSRQAKPKIKDMARDQKDRIRQQDIR